MVDNPSISIEISAHTDAIGKLMIMHCYLAKGQKQLQNIWLKEELIHLDYMLLVMENLCQLQAMTKKMEEKNRRVEFTLIKK